ncbi:hypothetical protein [Serinicoccus kebangsaanensis]|uniref:hypothetical protein n=1 Tax=Serinicoccus kebangsaanensis TaxID=2602069 RepID=UPI00124CD951|nr:hypothetical protein [Serinicoccus kebangsaanensis]
MSFENLPDDWPTRSLDDPALAADVVDLVVSDADRSAGALGFLLCRPGGSLAQPVVVGEVGREDPREVVGRMIPVIEDLPDTPGFVLVLARPRGGVTDADRSLHQYALDACQDAGLSLWGTYLATHAGVTHLPVAAGLVPRTGAA